MNADDQERLRSACTGGLEDAACEEVGLACIGLRVVWLVLCGKVGPSFHICDSVNKILEKNPSQGGEGDHVAVRSKIVRVEK